MDAALARLALAFGALALAAIGLYGVMTFQVAARRSEIGGIGVGPAPLAAVGALAAVIPTRNAARVDPLTAIRSE